MATYTGGNDWFYDKNNWSCYSKNTNKTWENLEHDKNYGKWTVSVASSHPFPSLPTNEEMMSSILDRLEDKGFFEDIMAWIRDAVAPRRIRSFLKSLCPSATPGRISYEDLCESVYQIGFRASPVLERRMILGPSNQWVRKYFEDFPFGGQK